jgi:hypothetical protein
MPKGAQPARREEGAYPLPIFNRRATPQDGMHRFANADVFVGWDTILSNRQLSFVKCQSAAGASLN